MFGISVNEVETATAYLPAAISQIFLAVSTHSRNAGSDGLKTICFNEVAARQTTVYNSLLLEWIRIQLNGTNSDPILAKGGKIGFTLGALEDLLRKFSSYLAYLILVKQNIDQQKFKMNRLDVAQKSEKRLREIAGKTSFIPFWDENVDPRARTLRIITWRKSTHFTMYISLNS